MCLEWLGEKEGGGWREEGTYERMYLPLQTVGRVCWRVR